MDQESSYRRYKRNLSRVKLVGQANKIRRRMMDSAERFESRNRVTLTTIFLMVGVGLMYDVLQALINFIPYIGWVLSSVLGGYAWLTFYMWTSVKGWRKTDTMAKWLTPKRVIKTILTVI